MMSMHERSSLLWDVSADLSIAIDALKATSSYLQSLGMTDEYAFMVRTIPALTRLAESSRRESNRLHEMEGDE